MDSTRFPGANVQTEPPFGIEPKTFRLQGGCSTTELGRRTANAELKRGNYDTRKRHKRTRLVQGRLPSCALEY